MIEFFKTVIRKQLCALDFHEEKLLAEDQDPYLGQAPGHRGTSVCLYCDKHRRVIAPIGDSTDNNLRVMPWVRWPK